MAKIVGIEDGAELLHIVYLDTHFGAEFLEESEVTHFRIFKIMVFECIEQILFFALVVTYSLVKLVDKFPFEPKWLKTGLTFPSKSSFFDVWLNSLKF